MQLESCIKCEHYSHGVCVRKGKPIARIRGCSLSDSGKLFFKPRHGKEAFRLHVLKLKKEGSE